MSIAEERVPQPVATEPVVESPVASPAESGAEAQAAAPVDSSAPPAGPPAAPLAVRPDAATTVVAIGGGLLAMLDTTIVNVSLGATTGAFGDIDSVQWVVTAYLLDLAASMPATAWLARRFGVKRVHLASLAVFAIGSAACALSPTLPLLIGSRALAGAAAGILTPVSTILLTRGIPRDQLGRVQTLNGSVMLIGPLLGPTIGGLLVALGGWPAVYAINVPLCLVLFVVAVRRVAPDTRPADGAGARPSPLDVLGLLSAAVATTAIVLVIRELAGPAPDLAKGLGLVALLVVSAAVFVLRGLRGRHPLMDLRLFGIGVYRTAAVNVFFLGFVLYGPMVVIPLYFEVTRGLTAVDTGLLLSTSGIGVVLAGRICRPLMKKLGGGATMIIGISLTLVATVPLTLLAADTSFVLLCGSLVVRGIGTGLTIVPAMTRAFESIPARSIPDASPQLNLLQRIGGAVAAAVVTVVLHREAVLAGGLVPQAFAQSCFWVLVTSAVTLVPAVALMRAERRSKNAV